MNDSWWFIATEVIAGAAFLWSIYSLGYHIGYMTCCSRHGIVTGEAARKIVDEIRNGTPSTPKRIEAIRRADAVYKKVKEQMRGKL